LPTTGKVGDINRVSILGMISDQLDKDIMTGQNIQSTLSKYSVMAEK